MDATDIHIEPYTTTSGCATASTVLLQDIPVPTGLRQLYDTIVSRPENHGRLNIAERRTPHDGRISMKTRQGGILPARLHHPYKARRAVCMRILGRQSLFLDLAQLGMEPDNRRLWNR